ncbi:MAG: hypothetical protein IJ405_08435 [Lachnospiraceae bacterium]|nr:hypothetical protein [Lachnospiraceae bacterium]
MKNLEIRRKKTKTWKLKGFKEFLKEEDGMGTVEVILIIVVLVGLVLIFKEEISDIIDSLFSKITSQTNRL